MPDFVAERAVMAAMDELAEGGMAERMRLDAGSRVLVTARRMLPLVARDAVAAVASSPVLLIARAWDPTATTAAEHVEALEPAELDAFLAAAPRWAALVRAAGGRAMRHAA